MKKKYFCKKCYATWEGEQPSACPECKHTEVAEFEKDFEVVTGIIEKKMGELKAFNQNFLTHVQDEAGGKMGKKAIHKHVFTPDKHGNKTIYQGVSFEQLDDETEKWGKNLQRYIKGGMAEVYKSGQPIVTKDPHGLNENIPGQGGYLVQPQTIQNVIIEGVMNQSIFLSKAFKVPMTSNLVRIPRLKQQLDADDQVNDLSFFGGVAWSYLNDAGVKKTTRPEIEYLQFSPYEHAALVPLSHSLIADASIVVVEYVTNLMIRSFAYLIDHDCLVGNGAGKCLGICNTPGVLEVLRQTSGEVHLVDFNNMDMRLNDLFDPTAEWFVRSSIAKKLRQDYNKTTSMPYWLEMGYQASLAQGFRPLSIGGRTPNYTYNTPKVGSYGDVVLGPPEQYWLAVRKELTVDESDHFYFDTNEKAIRFVARLDGKAAIPQAFVVLSDSTK